MTNYKTGNHGSFFWIEFSGTDFHLFNLLEKNSSIVYGKYLAIICFDSGPLNLVDEEKQNGWYKKSDIAYSPRLTHSLISHLPTEQYDQWCLFDTPTHLSKMTDFVNHMGFTLSGYITKYNSQDLIAKFWKEIAEINPVNFISDGDNFIFISKEIREIELLRNENSR